MARKTTQSDWAGNNSEPRPRHRLVLLTFLVGLSVAALYLVGFDMQSLRNWWQPKPAAVADSPPHENELIAGEGVIAAPAAPRGNDSSASPVPLALVLVSTQPGPKPTMGKALIGVFRDSPQTYIGGALLANGARLAGIYNDYVVLEKGGRSVRLYLDPKKQTDDLSNSLLTVGGDPAVATPEPTSVDVLTQYIRPSPVYDSDQLIGFEVYAGSNLGVFMELGLQPGDVITSLGGLPLTEVTSSWEAFKQLERGASLSATVRRAGTVETVYLDGQLISQAQLAAQQPAPAQFAMPPGG